MENEVTKSAHTKEERAHLLAAVGAPPEAIEQAVEQEQQPEQPKSTRKKAKVKEVDNTSLEQDADAVVRSIVERAGADREAALRMCDEHVQAVFDANKVSKVEAAARGLVSTDHNKALWTAVQTLRTTLKTKVRKHYTSTIAAKVRKTSAAAQETRDNAFEAFVSSDAFMAAFEAFKQSQEG
jgi:hypothetical protein